MIRRLTAALLAAALCLLAGCSGPAPSSPAPAAPSDPAPEAPGTACTFTDALGNTVTVDRPQRVVSFYGSFAEMWILAGGELAGTTDDAITERKLPLGEDVAIIGSTRNPNLEMALGLDADFAILSADTTDHVQAAETLRAAGVTCAFFRVDTLEDYLAAMEVCTSITGRADLYEQNALAVQRQAQEVIQRVRPLLEEEPVTALLIRAYSTGAKAKGMDNLAGVMLHQLGVKNLVDQHPSLLEELSMEEIIAADPDYIFVTIMGSSQQKALDALAEGIQKNPAWSSLSAVQNGRYVILPGDLFHYKPNARWGESYAYLADILCPGALEG
ncbi:MAG: ABC transporter substrate-binding protein [Angelakisella sp.]|jgi:iron complex transport system substrate-binding protein|nr:ABC transporter substrate-binding protein [Angelakisella sp.]